MKDSKFINTLNKLHNEERGDVPVGPILVIGLIAIPMIIALVVFRDEMLSYMRERLNDFTGASTNATL